MTRLICLCRVLNWIFRRGTNKNLKPVLAESLNNLFWADQATSVGSVSPYFIPLGYSESVVTSGFLGSHTPVTTPLRVDVINTILRSAFRCNKWGVARRPPARVSRGTTVSTIRFLPLCGWSHTAGLRVFLVIYNVQYRDHVALILDLIFRGVPGNSSECIRRVRMRKWPQIPTQLNVPQSVPEFNIFSSILTLIERSHETCLYSEE